ncbi:MAG: endolytic transglycosylase MltG [Steroidobacteraceae bacterium]
MAKRRLRLALVIVIVLGAIAIFGYLQLQRAATEPGPATADARVIVPAGASLRTALRQLESQGYLRDPRLFEIFLRCCRNGVGAAAPAVKAGHYLVTAGARPLDILQQLVDGRVILEQLTLVEGWTFTQWRAALDAHAEITHTLAGAKDAEIMAALGAPTQFPEGRFAPDTYRFSSGTSDLDILRMAWLAQQRVLDEAWSSRESGLPVTTPDEALVLASIVEKETGLAAERAQVAGVFTNRLRKGMRLQSDPTVIYGIRERYDGNIRRSDLIADTPYNTYTRTGLPPTPIAMPGRDAIQATLHPAVGDALYFVATGDGSGGHTFSATLEAHNQAVQRYLQRLRSSGTR